MELGLPDIGNMDLVGAFFYFMGNVPTILISAWNGLVAFVGGNQVVAIIIVGLIGYVAVDIVFHVAIDNPTRKAGQIISTRLIGMVGFLSILAIVSMFIFA